MRIENASGTRANKRRPFDGALVISWQTGSGVMKSISGKCVDLSDDGLRVECDSSIEPRTNVYVRGPVLGLMGNASVRFCRRSGLKYIVGLLFSSVASQADQGRKRLIQSHPNAEG